MYNGLRRVIPVKNVFNTHRSVFFTKKVGKSLPGYVQKYWEQN